MQFVSNLEKQQFYLCPIHSVVNKIIKFWLESSHFVISRYTESLLILVSESMVPDMPDRLVVRPMTNSLMVQWVPNRRSKYLVRGYYLGYGKGIPDVYRQLFDANTFFFTIDNLRMYSCMIFI